MLHLSLEPAREPETQDRPPAYAEAVARLASIRHALRLIEPFAGGPAPDLSDDAAIAAAWTCAGGARQRAFDRRSGRLVGSTAAGLDALLKERQADRTPNEAASQVLVDEIRRELRDVAGIILG